MKNLRFSSPDLSYSEAQASLTTRYCLLHKFAILY